jgi:hypothetical protein
MPGIRKSPISLSLTASQQHKLLSLSQRASLFRSAHHQHTDQLTSYIHTDWCAISTWLANALCSQLQMRPRGSKGSSRASSRGERRGSARRRKTSPRLQPPPKLLPPTTRSPPRPRSLIQLRLRVLLRRRILLQPPMLIRLRLPCRLRALRLQTLLRLLLVWIHISLFLRLTRQTDSR